MTVTKHSILNRKLISKVNVLELKGTSIIPHSYNAVWDTGAQGTAIASQIISKLKLVPTGQTVTMKTVKGLITTKTYICTIQPDGHSKGFGLIVGELLNVNDKNPVNMLIGMDLIELLLKLTVNQTHFEIET